MKVTFEGEKNSEGGKKDSYTGGRGKGVQAEDIASL